jgi:integrase/recombinase XerD
MNGELRSALVELSALRPAKNETRHIIVTERGAPTSPQVIVNLFFTWYREVGFRGCSSHSGRRTFITNAARKISSVGGSLRDVQALAGHANLGTTQAYIDVDGEAQRKVVELV